MTGPEMPSFKGSPFKMDLEEKDSYLTKQLKSLTEYHRSACPAYGAMLDALSYSPDHIRHYSDLPFLPVGLFKSMTLSSLKDNEDYKTVTSSGTTGQHLSRIILDGETRSMQQMALTMIGSDFLGPKRLPMLVIDCPSVLSKRDHFSARTSGILGFSIFGRKRTFALNDDMTINREALTAFLDAYGDGPFLVFGFTYMIWQYFCLQSEMMPEHHDLSNAVLIHGGGWKKLQNLNISKSEFKRELKKRFGIVKVHDYYGMAEQTGSIFMECECGHLHASDYSGILFRRPEDFSVCKTGERGIIQVLSILPRSYPGHSLLTEDEGCLLGRDDCPCGRKGDYFEVYGRIPHAQIRGCSDTYEG